MKGLMKAIGILLVAALVVSGLPNRMPSTAEAKPPLGLDDQVWSTASTEEAEKARALVLEGLCWMQYLSLGDGLHINPTQQLMQLMPNCSITYCCTHDCSWVRVCCSYHTCLSWTWWPVCLGWPPCCLEWAMGYFCECYPIWALPTGIGEGE